MYDDATHGDQRSGDNVWSYSETFSPGIKLLYVYTNSGEKGRWEGLDIPEIRRFIVKAPKQGAKVYRPIESFGEKYMQADGWHTNAEGYGLIAKAILKVLEEDERVRKYVSMTRMSNRIDVVAQPNLTAKHEAMFRKSGGESDDNK
jgi:hypothetical protein